MALKPATPQLELVLPGAPASQFHPTPAERPCRSARSSGSLIRQALYLDQEDAYAAGEAVPPALLGVGFLVRALVQATLPHSDPKANELFRRNGHFTLSILAPEDVGLPFGRYPRLVLACLTTEAVRRKSPDIELGSHFSLVCVRSCSAIRLGSLKTTVIPIAACRKDDSEVLRPVTGKDHQIRSLSGRYGNERRGSVRSTVQRRPREPMS